MHWLVYMQDNSFKCKLHLKIPQVVALLESFVKSSIYRYRLRIAQDIHMCLGTESSLEYNGVSFMG